MPDVQPTNNPVPSDHPADARDNFKRIDEIVNLQAAQTNPTRTGKRLNTLFGIESNYIASPINGGVWASGVTFTAYNQYMAFNGVSYKPSFSTPLPYETQGSDPTVSPDSNFVEPFSEINSTNISNYTDIVYKDSGGNSAVENMIAGNPVASKVGDACTCYNGTRFTRVSDTASDITDFECLNEGFVGDFWNTSDSSSDSSSALNLYASTCPEFNIPEDVSLFINSEVLIPHANVDISGKITAVGADGSFSSGAAVTIGSYAAQLLTTIGSATTTGDASFNLLSTSNIDVGDILTIYDSTDFSFAPQRNYYRAGEHVKVSEVVSSTEIVGVTPSWDDYGVGIEVYKLNPKKCNIKSLNVHINSEALYAVTIESLFEGLVLNSTCSGGRVATIHRNRCYDVTFLNPSNTQNFDDSSVTNYAHYTLSCQNVVDINPYVRAFRHALTLTGREQVLSIPNRMCGSSGGSAFTRASTPGVTAVDFHGCTESCFYDDMDIFGGSNIGGKNNRVRSRIYQQNQPSVIRGGELVNANHDFKGSKLFTSLAGSQNGGQWIDIGSLTTVIGSDLKAGGLLNFQDIEIDTSAGNPSSLSKSVDIKNRGYLGGDLNVSFRGARRVGDVNQSNWATMLISDIVSGSAFNKVDVINASMDGIAMEIIGNDVCTDGYKSTGSSVMSQNSIGLEVFVADGKVSMASVHVEDTNLSPINIRGYTPVSGAKKAYLGDIKAIDGNQVAGSTTEENSGLALRDLDFAQYNDVLTVGSAVNASAVNALRANNVTTLVVGSWYADGYATNGLSLAGATTAVDMKFGNVAP